MSGNFNFLDKIMKMIDSLWPEKAIKVREFEALTLKEMMLSEKIKISNLREEHRCHPFIIEEMRVRSGNKLKVIKGEKIVESYYSED